MKKIKKDNSGFTLIELLIAIAIIAIVLTPLYSNFRQSTYLNGKAKQAMNATNMASNLMEGLSAYTPEEIILGFYSNDSVSGNIPGRQNTLNIIPNEVVVAEYGDLAVDPSGNLSKGFITSNLALGAATYDYSTANYAQPLGAAVPQPSMEYLKIKKSPSGKYYFYASGVQQARGTYDIVVKLDTTYDTGFSGDSNKNGVLDSGEMVGVNDYEEAQITSVNPLFDGVYTENVGQRANAASALLGQKRPGTGITLDVEDLYAGMEREVTIEVDRDVTTGFVTVMAKEKYAVRYDFTPPGKSTVNVGSFFNSVPAEYSTADKLIFDGSVYKQDPRNIYIYYTANYNSSFSRKLDKFVVKNDQHVPVNIYLIRIASTETDAATEGGYCSSLAVDEPYSSDGYKTDIYSNLRDDLTKSNADNETYRTQFNRCEIKINGAMIGNVDDAAYKEIIHESGGVKKEVKDRMYGVTMYVYEEGAANAGFPEDMLITEFDGSSLQ